MNINLCGSISNQISDESENLHVTTAAEDDDDGYYLDESRDQVRVGILMRFENEMETVN